MQIGQQLQIFGINHDLEVFRHFALKASYTFSESEWHLIIGGAGSPNTAELFNWHTNQQCQLPDLPVGVYGHVAAFMEGVPVFCEAGKNQR